MSDTTPTPRKLIVEPFVVKVNDIDILFQVKEALRETKNAITGAPERKQYIGPNLDELTFEQLVQAVGGEDNVVDMIGRHLDKTARATYELAVNENGEFSPEEFSLQFRPVGLAEETKKDLLAKLDELNAKAADMCRSSDYTQEDILNLFKEIGATKVAIEAKSRKPRTDATK